MRSVEEKSDSCKFGSYFNGLFSVYIMVTMSQKLGDTRLVLKVLTVVCAGCLALSWASSPGAFLLCPGAGIIAHTAVCVCSGSEELF